MIDPPIIVMLIPLWDFGYHIIIEEIRYWSWYKSFPIFYLFYLTGPGKIISIIGEKGICQTKTSS